MESHISGLAYVAAAAFLFAIFPLNSGRNRAVEAFPVLAISLTAWILTAWWLGQIGGHPIEGGRFSFVETLLQMSGGIGSFVLPSLGQAFGLMVWIAIFGALLWPSSKAHLNPAFFVFLFSLISLSLLALAFTITWLNGLVSESRHLLIVPLLVIPVLVGGLLSSDARIIKTAALMVFLAPIPRTLILNDSVASGDFVPVFASISPLPRYGKTITVNGKTLIGPIPWEEPEGGYSSSGAPRWGSSQAGVRSSSIIPNPGDPFVNARNPMRD